MATAALTAPVENGGALVLSTDRHAVRLLRPVAAPAQMIESQNATRAFIKEVLQKDQDFGVIPGTDRPTLLKPGAEKVVLGFGCTATTRIVEKEVDHDRPVTYHKRKKVWANKYKGDRDFTWATEEGQSLGLYRYVVEVNIVDSDGVIRGTGLGVCSTLESKYVDRPRECENTALKMAFKRAHVAAVLTTFGLSDSFTQDMEESQEAAQQPQGTEASGEREEAAAQPEITTIEQAKAVLVPGASTAFNGQGGRPLGDISPKLLASVVKWCQKKNDEAVEQKADPDPVKATVVKAGQMLLDHWKAEGAPAKSAEKAEESAAAPAEEEVLPSVASLLKRYNELLEQGATSKALSDDMVAQLRHDGIEHGKVNTGANARWLITATKDLEQIVGINGNAKTQVKF